MGVNLRGSATPNPGAPGGILQAIFDGVGEIGEALAEGLNGVIGMIADALFGNYTGDNPALIAIRDGQLALNNRVDLLGSSAYCATYMGPSFRIGPRRNRALPFDSQIGPPQDAQLVQVTRSHPGVSEGPLAEWCIRLDRAGLWEAQVHIQHRNSHNVTTGFVYAWAEIVVLDPELNVWSITRGHSPAPSDNNKHVDIVFPKRFVVDTPGYYVQVRYFWSDSLGMRRVIGGAASSSFSVIQWSDEIDGTANDDPNGEIGGGSDRPGGDADTGP